MRIITLAISLSISILVATHQVIALPSSPTVQSKIALGWIERALIYPGIFPLNAKLDTGADNSSLHAENLEFFSESGKQFVRFSLFNRHGDRHEMVAPVLRTTKVKLKGGGLQRRPVIRLGLCLGNLFQEVDFNLVDRSHFYYPMLIGRSFLSGNIVVDSSKTYSTEPSCQPQSD